MLKIGLTGGMGCGKSTIAHIFSALDIPVYHADERAKRLSEKPETQARIARLFGEEAAQDRRLLASIVFADVAKLAQLNALVHPLVFEDMENWFTQQESAIGKPPYAVVEAAILFESGMEKLFDYIVTVETPQEVQIARTMKRDGSTREQVLARLSRQLSTEIRQQKADFVLFNDSIRPVLPDVLKLDKEFRLGKKINRNKQMTDVWPLSAIQER